MWAIENSYRLNSFSGIGSIYLIGKHRTATIENGQL